MRFLDECGTQSHRAELEALVNRHRTSGEQLVYSSDFVVSPKFQKTPISYAAHELKIGFESLWDAPIHAGNQPIGADEFFVLVLQTPSQFAKDCYEKHRRVIDERTRY